MTNDELLRAAEAAITELRAQCEVYQEEIKKLNRAVDSLSQALTIYGSSSLFPPSGD